MYSASNSEHFRILATSNMEIGTTFNRAWKLRAGTFEIKNKKTK